MLYKIHSHAEIQALQACTDELGHSNEDMLVNLVSLESVRIACESYALLWPLIKELSWACPKLENLSVVAALSLEIQKLEHDVLPQLMVQEAKLERGALQAVLVMQNSAVKLLHLAKCYKEALGRLQDLVSRRAEDVSIMLDDIVVHVLEGNCNIFWLQARLLVLFRMVTIMLETPVCFCDPVEYSDE
ncbi:hypothetical protein CFC21_059917 [Triticum aestivum]|uniref:Uncharacterized protein n=3 Tax=Triticum TaxID=4564 RepID=A0A9R1GRN2_WHEAT|nr:uncharacterized protein LOC123089838 [Triticum aestivum]KAF7051683.1 hypothetical protein CFC21_059898 [Triticum aestivum]KAF7051703.1 hypothetical protein CFC21_059917 [Triticum aestivum]VAI11732.1 unnamed protein product [Triticum turgidum subsp. durum]